MSISNDVSLGAINHSELMRGIVQKYRMKYRWGIQKYVGVLSQRAACDDVRGRRPDMGLGALVDVGTSRRF